MKQQFQPLGILFFLLSIFVFHTQHLQAQSIKQDWHVNLNPFSPANEYSAKASVDAQGSAYWAINLIDSFSGLHYIWLAKLDTFYNVKWKQYYDGGAGADFTDLKTDAAGNSYLYGIHYEGSSNGTNTPFLRKYDNNGNLLWFTDFDYDTDNEEVPDQIAISPHTGDVITTASISNPFRKLVLGRFTSQGIKIWDTSYYNYEAGDVLVDDSDRIHLTTTYFNGDTITDDHFAYLLLSGNGAIKNGFTQVGGSYSYAMKTGSKGKTVGIDEIGNFYCLGWVYSFPFEDTSWTNTMVYKFDTAGEEIWSKRLNRVQEGYPPSYATLLTDYSSGDLSVIGGEGLWRYSTDGVSDGGWYDAGRNFVDATMYSPDFTFALSTGIAVDNDSGKITHFDWTDTSVYDHGRANIQYLNETAIVEPDAAHAAMYVTWSYLGKVSLHRLVLRDTVTSVNELLAEENLISLFPNPASDEVTLVLNENFRKPFNMEIENMEGKILYRKFLITEKSVMLPLNNLSAGIYSIVITVDGNRMLKKLVVR